MKNFAELASSLSRLTGDVSSKWTDAEQLSFAILRTKCSTSVAMHGFDWSQPAQMFTDASKFGLGMVIMQERADPSRPGKRLLVPIAFDAFTLSKTEVRYSTYKKELFAIVKSLRKYGHYFRDANRPGIVHTDHKPLVFFLDSEDHEGIYARWVFEVRQLNLTIHYIQGERNKIADGLSRTLFHHPECDSDPFVRETFAKLKINGQYWLWKDGAGVFNDLMNGKGIEKPFV